MVQRRSNFFRENNKPGHFLHVFSCVISISLIYVQGCEKRNPTHTCQLGPKIRSANSNFVDLDRFRFCRALFRGGTTLCSRGSNEPPNFKKKKKELYIFNIFFCQFNTYINFFLKIFLHTLTKILYTLITSISNSKVRVSICEL